MAAEFSGWLEKKSGGKEGKSAKLFDKWDKRYFVLVGTELRYFKHEDDHKKGTERAGHHECMGAELFLKEVQGTRFRFTVQNKERELTLRAPNAAAYQGWANALAPMVAAAGRGSTMSMDSDYGGLTRDGAGSASIPMAPRESDAPASCTGWLEKKSGGKEGHAKSKLLQHWEKRFFALIGTELRYFKSEEDHIHAKPSLGFLNVAGAKLFLKEVKGQTFRFTVQTAQRELKLRADNAAEYQKWTLALGPLVNPETHVMEEGADDSASTSSGRSRTATIDAMANAFFDEMDTDRKESVDNAEALALQPLAEDIEDVDEVDDEPSSMPSFGGTMPSFSKHKPTPPNLRLERSPTLDQILSDADADADETPAPLPAAPLAAKPPPRPSNAPSLESTLPHPLGSPSAAPPAANRFGAAPNGASGDGTPTKRNSFLSRVGQMLSPSPRNSLSGAAPTTASPKASGSASNPFDDAPADVGGAGGGGGNPFGAEEEDDGFDAAAFAAAAAGMIPIPSPTRPRGESAYDITPAGVRSLDSVDGPPFKIIIVGDSAVGKTSLLVRFTEGRFISDTKPTLCVDISNASLDLGSSTVGLALWDTAGQERFAALSGPYFRQADGVIVVFDVGMRSSFNRVNTYWMDELNFKAGPDASVMLIGSKADVPADERQVSTDEAQALADEHGWLYFETSAKSGFHVRDAFYLLACTVMNRLIEKDPKNLINTFESVSKISIQNGNGAVKGGCC